MASSLEPTAIVTGAGSGVGQAVALTLAATGYRLHLVGRTAATLAATADQIGPRRAAQWYAVDLTDEARVRELGERLGQAAPSVDVLVHSAGVHGLGAVDTTPVEEVDRQHRTNVRAPYQLTQMLLPALRRARGQIIFVNSTAGLVARGGVSAYAASKHALKAIADSVRDEVNPDGVRVLSVYLGRTASPMQEQIHHAEGRPYRPERLVQPGDVAAMIVAAVQLPSTAEVTDISIRPLQKPMDS